MKSKLLLPIFLLLFCMTIILAGCGSGSGTGSSSEPGGVNTGVPTVVKLLPVQFIAQTNSFITLKARVLDGNGNAVQNYPVSFTNMSLTGDLSAATANTNELGNAEVRIFSTTPGFATILAQVTTGSGIVRDRKTVYFSTNDVLRATMSLDVNSVPGNALYNELSDFTLFETATDDTVEVLATVFDVGGVPVGAGVGVSWSASHAEAKFIRTETETNVFGEAKAIIQVTPASIRDTETNLNISAFSDNGAGNMVTLFLQPVVVSVGTSSLTANPTTVAPGGTSTLSALVKLNTGGAAPDGTTVNFASTCVPPGGSVTPFGQTTGGLAPGTFTAPAIEGTCTVTATVQGQVIGSVTIKVAKELAVFPTSVTLATGATSGNIVITGGNPPYSITSSDTTKAVVNGSPVAASGGAFTVTAGATTGSATIQVRDASGNTVTVAITVSSAVCTVAAPTVTVVPAINQSISAAAPAAVIYTITVKNNDSATCASSTFTLTKTSDSAVLPTASFASSVLSPTAPAPCALAPLGICTATLTHTPTAGPIATNTLTTVVTAAGAGHPSATATLTTTIGP